jgi:hypothetical protein
LRPIDARDTSSKSYAFAHLLPSGIISLVAVYIDQRNIISIFIMSDQLTEKPEVDTPAPDAQEAPSAEKPVEQSSTGDDAAMTDVEGNKEETKVAEGKS